MAISTKMNNTVITPQEAISRSKASSAAGSISKTNRGTPIVKSDNSFGKDTFLNILVAQLRNLDPTQDQDSTAYVTQMAQFGSIEQLNNLNTTMENTAYQQMVGKVAILSEKDEQENNKWGLITQIVQSGTSTKATVQDTRTGEISEVDIRKIIGTSDSGYTTANFETALNSNFLSASTLANNNSKAIIVETSKIKTDKEITTTTKAYDCTIKSAYLDKQNGAVKVNVEITDEDGNVSSKVCDYNDIIIAGDLSDDLTESIIKENTKKITSYNTDNA